MDTLGTEPRGAMTNAFYLFLRRMRFPLILIIIIYTICVVGLALMPGVDPQGQRTVGMGIFNAFYVISYTGTTIGFGELPVPWSAEQRLWMTLSIYMTVVGWSYTVFTVIGLVQEPAFQNTVRTGRFAWRINHLREPFYIVCGYGETGSMVCHGLDRLGLRFVVIERDAERLEDLRLDEFQTDVPMLNADASQPATMKEAGLLSRFCRGVMALAVDDDANRAIAVTVRLLAPHVPVLARVRDQEAMDTTLGAFGGDTVINPFERFAEALASAVTTPEQYRLREILTGLPGADWPESHRPPRGHWIMCGYGRFGHAVREKLANAGLSVSVIDRLHYGEPGVDIEGTGTDKASLTAAGIEKAVGIVAGNANDLKNLAIAITARDLKPDIFIVTRQNQTSNGPLFKAFLDDLCMVPSRIVAREFLALITTPLLGRFLGFIPGNSEEWCLELIDSLSKVNDRQIPEIWSRQINKREGEAALMACERSEEVTLGQLLADPYDRRARLPALLLLVWRGGEVLPLPGDDVVLQPGDELLFAGSVRTQRAVDMIMQNDNVLGYVRSGVELSGGLIWRGLRRLRRRL